MNSDSSLTVLICTYNRADLLDHCLSSLVKQTDSDFDVLVINNNSSDQTSEVIAEYADRLTISELLEKEQGLSFARNAGYLAATGDWVGYLDDDAMARADWIAQIKATIKLNLFEAFGGIYLPWYLYGKVNWFKDDYGSNRRFFPEEGIYELSGMQFISGGNAVYRREALLNSTGFPTHLGMTGDTLRYGEEIVLQRELQQQGVQLGINTKLIIDHLVPKRKQEVSFFIESSKAKGAVYWADRNKSFDKLTFFCLQGLLSVSFLLLKSMLKMLTPEYYAENLKIDVLGKFHLYKEGIKNYWR